MSQKFLFMKQFSKTALLQMEGLFTVDDLIRVADTLWQAFRSVGVVLSETCDYLNTVSQFCDHFGDLHHIVGRTESIIHYYQQGLELGNRWFFNTLTAREAKHPYRKATAEWPVYMALSANMKSLYVYIGSSTANGGIACN